MGKGGATAAAEAASLASFVNRRERSVLQIMPSSSPDSSGPGVPYRWTSLIGGLIAKILIPIVIAWVGWSYSSAIKEQEVGATYVKLSLDILEEFPSNRPQGLDEWAMDVIDRYSGVPLSAEARRALTEVPLFYQELARIGVTAAERGQFEIEGIGRGEIEVKSVGPDGVDGFRAQTSFGSPVARNRLTRGESVALGGKDGLEVFVRLLSTDSKNSAAAFAILAPKPSRRLPAASPTAAADQSEQDR
jgi:hypothetical protein